MEKVKLSSPWEIFYKQVEAMFVNDPDITVQIEEEDYTIKLLVDNTLKAMALDALLPTSKVFGNITVQLQVVPSNSATFSTAQLFELAFRDNPVFSFAKTIEASPESFAGTYVVFEKEIAQYFSDNLRSIYGITSILYEDLAREIFTDSKVFFCTEI